MSTLMAWLDINDNIQDINVVWWALLTTLSSWINATNDTLKVESQWQGYYDLLSNNMVMALNVVQTLWAGSNYALSASWGWIVHPDIKRAKGIQFYWNFSQSTEVKLICSPSDAPTVSTPEFYYRWNGDNEYMFQDKTGTAFTPNFPACSRILPISCDALKFYIKTTTWWAHTINNIRVRLIF